VRSCLAFPYPSNSNHNKYLHRSSSPGSSPPSLRVLRELSLSY
jgi:hypothetical protein